MKWTQQMVDDFNRKTSKQLEDANTVPPDAVDKESLLHQQIIQECKQRRWIAFYGAMHTKAMRVPGEMDFSILADNGRLILLECKTRTGKLSEEQQAMKYHANLLGHTIHVVRSMTEVLAIFDALSTKENQ